MGFSYGLTPIIGGLHANKEYHKAGETLKNNLFYQFHRRSIIKYFDAPAPVEHRYFKTAGRVDALYRSLLYLTALFSVIFAMLSNSFKQFSDGTTDTVTPMWIMLGANVLNIIGELFSYLWKIRRSEMGLTGAGISTLASRILTFIVFCVLFARREKYKEFLTGFKNGVVNSLNLSNLIRLGFPVGLLMGG